MRVIFLLLVFYPAYSIAECDALNTINHNFQSSGSSAIDMEYDTLIRQYVDKYDHNFRPEAFFNFWEKLYSKAKSTSDLHLRKMFIDKHNKTISGYLHFDSSIEKSFMRLAQEKYSKSFYCLGYVYEKGIGKKVNYIKAWAWFYTASAVDGIYAKKDLNRVWQHLGMDDEIKAKRLADKYIRLYTNFNSTPSVTILK